MSADRQDRQFSISTLLQGVVLVAVLWVGSSIEELKGSVKVHEWRLQQLEDVKKAR